jgi:hypothetical protein
MYGPSTVGVRVLYGLSTLKKGLIRVNTAKYGLSTKNRPSKGQTHQTMNHKRNGKIARLPEEVREMINQNLRAGQSYPAILEQLQALGHPGFKLNNLSGWFQGGYQDWDRARQQAETLKTEREFALQIVKEKGAGTLQAASVELASLQLFKLLSRFDVEALQAELEPSSKQYGELLAMFSRLMHRTLELQKFKLLSDQREEELNGGPGRGERGIPPEKLEYIKSQLRLLA